MNATINDIIKVDADTFYTNFKRHKDEGNIINTEQVLLRELDYYKENCNLFFMTKDFSAGAALEKDGRIISVFNAGNYRKVGSVLLDCAIKSGGNKLECNDVAQLRYIYGKRGFVPVAKAPLDTNDIYYEILKMKENEEDHGTTLLFWIYDENEYQKIKKNMQEYTILFCNIKKFDTEEEAEEFRDLILEEVKDGNLSDDFKQYVSNIIQIKKEVKI